MRRAAAGLLLSALILAHAPAQSPTPETDPLLAQRRLAFVLRQATQHYEAGEYQAALDRLGSLPAPAAADPAARNLRGAVLTKLGDSEAAAAVFNEILASDPGYFPAAFNLAEVRYTQGDYKAALEAFLAMHATDPRNELLRFKIALCHLRLGNTDDARKFAESLIPAGSTPAWYYSQAILARAGGDEKSASRHLTAARVIYGDDACRLFDESLKPASD